MLITEGEGSEGETGLRYIGDSVLEIVHYSMVSRKENTCRLLLKQTDAW